MLARLSIRDIVLIERLDIEFSRGLAVLTGETGAGKSILLDAFALALGGRGDSGLVRHGAEQGQVTATFDVPKGHPAARILSENGLDDTGEMILRRVQLADGRTRAFINDQSISVQTLKSVGAVLVETTLGLGGIGSLITDAIQNRDYPVSQASVLLLTVAFTVINLLTDILYAVIDPRIRY